MTLNRSLKVIQTGTIRKLACGFLFAFHSNYGRIFKRLFDIQFKVSCDLENRVRGCSRSLKIAPFDKPYTTFCWSTIVNIALSGTVFELFDVEWYHDLKIWVRGYSRSFKPVSFESLGAVSYSHLRDRDIGRKSWFFSYPLAFDAPVTRGLPVGKLPSRLV